MRAFFDIFQLELRALSRSWSLAMLSAASAVWMLAVPRLVVGDGTAEGMREVCLRYGLGGVMSLVTISMLAAATGSLFPFPCGSPSAFTARIPNRLFASVFHSGYCRQ